MKQLIIGALICILGLPVFSQPAKREIHQGNELYKKQKYAEAEAFYKQSVDKSKESLEGNFNLGDAWYKQKKYNDAIGKFTDIASTSSDKSVKAQAYHNLGNALLSSNKLEESINAYKKSLMNNPKDEQTRYNLAYAQEKLKQQQQQNKDNKNKDKNNKDNKENKDQQDKNKKDNKDQQGKDKKDKQDKDNKDKDNKDQQNKDSDKNDPNKDQQGQQPKPDQLSKEDAERLLDALNQEEKKTQDKLKDKKAKGVKGRIIKQW
ncbi:Tetratricopeptide repeat-containing protein [bacterium A37T11]|nr:Tetratricopeptide repeat-containing protein [bacterium A37T11]